MVKTRSMRTRSSGQHVVVDGADDLQLLSHQALLKSFNRRRFGCLLSENVVHVLFLGEKSAMTKRKDPKYHRRLMRVPVYLVGPTEPSSGNGGELDPSGNSVRMSNPGGEWSGTSGGWDVGSASPGGTVP